MPPMLTPIVYAACLPGVAGASLTRDARDMARILKSFPVPSFASGGAVLPRREHVVRMCPGCEDARYKLLN